MHPGARGGVGRHAVYDLLPAKPQLLPDGHAHRRGIDHEPPRRGDGQGVAALLRGHGAADPLDAALRYIRDADVAARPLAAAQGLEGQSQRVQQRVVSVEHRQPVGRQMRKNFALGAENALPRAVQIADVGVSHVGDDRHRGLHHLPHAGDLAEMIHAGLDDRRLVPLFQAEKSLGRADEIIVIGQRFQGVEVLSQHRRQHFFGGGFSGGACDLHHGDGKLPPIPAG